MLCATFGSAAALSFERWRDARSRRGLAVAGALAGAAMLTQPFALVVCVQLFFFVLVVEERWKDRLVSASLLVGSAPLVFTLWTPLILAHPEAFGSQFLNNVWRRSGPGLPQRILLPWHPIVAQCRLLLEHGGPYQAALMSAGLLLATVVDVRSARRGNRIALAWAWSSVALLIVCQGEHPA